MKATRNPFIAALFATLAASATSSLQAQTWDGNGAPNAGGNWSTANLWTLDTVPTTGNTANLDNTGADRTIIYDTGASGALGTLNFNQSSSFANILDIQKSLTVTNFITLGATAGSEEIRLTPSTTAELNLNASGGITLNSGGLLTMKANNDGTNQRLSRVTGNVTISGGTLTVSPSTLLTSANQREITGTLTMNSGTLTIDSGTSTGQSRLAANGVNITGGAVTRGTSTNANGQLVTTGTVNTISPATFEKNLSISLATNANQALTLGVAAGELIMRSFGTGTWTKTVTATSGSTVRRLTFGAGTANATTNLVLGANLTNDLTNTSMPFAGFGSTGNLVSFGIDTAGFTLDLRTTSNNTTWTPNVAGGGTNWNLTNTGTAGQGGIKVSNVSFTTATQVNIGAGAVVEITGGNSTAVNMGGGGTIDANSTFRYSGAAVTATPATLTSSRNLGDLEVSSGALKMLTASAGTVQDLRVSGGTLDLDANTGRTFATISQTGGTLANGTYATAETHYTGLQSGVVSGRLTGTGKKLIKDSPGTLTLSGTNDFTGAVEIKSGVLAITTVAAFGSTNQIDVMGGTLDLGGTNNLQKFTISLTNGGVIQNGALLRTSNTNYTWSDGTVSANLTTSGSGAINITKNTSGTVILSGANSHAGSTLVTAGTLQLSGSGTLGSGPVSVSGGTLDLGAKSLTNTLGVLSGGAINNGTITNDSGTYDLRKGSVGAVLAGTNGLTKSTADTVILSSANTYSGATLINGGTLKLDATGTIDNTSEVSLGTVGTFDVSAKGLGYTVGTLKGSGNVIGMLTVSTQLAIGNSPGTTNFSSSLTLDSATYVYEMTGGVTPGVGSADLGNVAGTLNITAGSILDLVELGTYTLGNKFTLFSYSTLSGAFDGLANNATFLDDLSNTWQIKYDDTTAGANSGSGSNFVTITAVPEPNAAVIGSIGGLLLFRRRRVEAISRS